MWDPSAAQQLGLDVTAEASFRLLGAEHRMRCCWTHSLLVRGTLSTCSPLLRRTPSRSLLDGGLENRWWEKAQDRFQEPILYYYQPITNYGPMVCSHEQSRVLAPLRKSRDEPRWISSPPPKKILNSIWKKFCCCDETAEEPTFPASPRN